MARGRGRPAHQASVGEACSSSRGRAALAIAARGRRPPRSPRRAGSSCPGRANRTSLRLESARRRFRGGRSAHAGPDKRPPGTGRPQPRPRGHVPASCLLERLAERRSMLFVFGGENASIGSSSISSSSLLMSESDRIAAAIVAARCCGCVGLWCGNGWSRHPGWLERPRRSRGPHARFKQSSVTWPRAASPSIVFLPHSRDPGQATAGRQLGAGNLGQDCFLGLLCWPQAECVLGAFPWRGQALPAQGCRLRHCTSRGRHAHSYIPPGTTVQPSSDAS
jgi:hypothetical protein